MAAAKMSKRTNEVVLFFSLEMKLLHTAKIFLLCIGKLPARQPASLPAVYGSTVRKRIKKNKNVEQPTACREEHGDELSKHVNSY